MVWVGGYKCNTDTNVILCSDNNEGTLSFYLCQLLRIFQVASHTLNCHDSKLGTKQEEHRFVRCSRHFDIFFFPLKICYVSLFIIYTVVLKFLSIVSVFNFNFQKCTCSKYLSKSWYILVDRTCHFLLFKYSEPFFRPSLN